MLSQGQFAEWAPLEGRPSPVFVRDQVPFEWSPSQGGSQAPFLSVRASLPFWKSIGAPQFVLSVIENGFSVHLDQGFYAKHDVSASARNRRSTSSDEASDWIEGTLMEWLKDGVVERAEGEQFTFPLHLVHNGKKPRLIHDLSGLNRFVPKSAFKLEDLSVMWPLLPAGGFLVTWDLRAGFHHVAVHEDSRHLFGIEWGSGDSRLKLRDVGLPFGFSLSPIVFTKFLRPLVKRWRAMGLTVAMYLDDGILLASSEQECFQGMQQVRRDLHQAGCQVAEDKSQWTPRQVGSWLGFAINLAAGTVEPSPERRQKALGRIRSLKSAQSPSIHDRQVVTGTVASVQLIAQDDVSFFSRFLNGAVDAMDAAGTERQELSEGELAELVYWETAFASGLRRSFGVDEPSAPATFEFEIETDASAIAAGALLRVQGKFASSCARNFSESEKGESSAMRELKAINLGLEAFAKQCRGCKVLVKTDSQAAVAILQKGSMRPLLHQQALRARQSSEMFGLQLRFRWVPRSENEAADMVSRDFDFDDWGISHTVFDILSRRWEPPAVDMFASAHNAKCERFFSRDAQPGSSGIDGLLQEEVWLDHHLLWCVPPIRLIPRVLSLARRCQSRLILGCPLWESAPFFPILKPNSEWAGFIRDKLVYGKGASIIVPSVGSHDLFSSNKAPSPFLFALCDFSGERI